MRRARWCWEAKIIYLLGLKKKMIVRLLFFFLQGVCISLTVWLFYEAVSKHCSCVLETASWRAFKLESGLKMSGTNDFGLTLGILTNYSKLCQCKGCICQVSYVFVLRALTPGPIVSHWVGRIRNMVRDCKLGRLSAHALNLYYLEKTGIMDSTCLKCCPRPGVPGHERKFSLVADSISQRPALWF